MKTLLKVSAILAAGALAIPTFAAADHGKALNHAMNKAAKTTVKPNMSKISYMIGFQVGSGFKKQNLGVNSSEFIKGYNSAMHGKKSAYTTAQTQAAMKQFQMFMMHKMAEKQAIAAKSNGAKSAAFIAKVSKQAGVKKLTDGVYYRVIKNGKGPMPKATDTVKVNYVGSLANGKVFDSSYKRKKPLTIGVNQVIPGWTKALQKMPVGSTWMLYLSPKEAYGKFAPPSIGANQALVFKVNLISIEPAKKG